MCQYRFENDVEMYGAQAQRAERRRGYLFENDVEMYGAQAACAGMLRGP